MMYGFARNDVCFASDVCGSAAVMLALWRVADLLIYFITSTNYFITSTGKSLCRVFGNGVFDSLCADRRAHGSRFAVVVVIVFKRKLQKYGAKYR